MTPEEVYLRFTVALAIGLGVGIERGWKQRDELPGRREAGVRTFAILSLLGFTAGLALDTLGPFFAAAMGLGVAAVIGIGYWREVNQENGDRGATTEVAALLTFALGALAATGALLAAGIIAVVLVLLLEQKEALHDFVGRIERLELTAALKLLLVSVALLPVLPDAGFGPGGVLNPKELWWAVVVIGALGFLGHIALRTVGTRLGAIFMGLMGGLVSSTGVTVSAARLARDAPAAGRPLASAVATAQTIMFVRTAALVAVLNPALLQGLWLPLTLGALAALASAFILVERTGRDGAAPPVITATPDTLLPAIKFVALVALVLVAAWYAQAWAGSWGIILSGLLSGAVDVDAATVSAARLSSASVTLADSSAAMLAIGAAIIANSIVKVLIAWFTGTPSMAWPVAASLGASAVALSMGLLVVFTGAS